MASINLNMIIGRYQNAFGITSALIHEQWLKSWNIPLYKPNDVSPNGNTGFPVFDKVDPLFSEMTFINKKTGKSYFFGTSGKGKTNNFLAPPLLPKFSRDKRVVRTPIDRSDIEVIEHFGLKPWEIKFQGILIDMEGHQYPKNLVTTLTEMFNAPGTYSVYGDLFEDKKIKEIFFEGGFDIDYVEGYADTVKFSVNAISTYPLEFYAQGF